MTALEPATPLNDNAGEPDEAQSVFVRVVDTAPGPPWDQSRQAELEAKLGAPSRLSELVYRVRRLDAWRPTQSARFAAIYARAQDAREGLRATAVIDGRTVSVWFGSPALYARRFSNAALVAGVAAVALVLTVVLAGAVTARRSASEQMLGAAEQQLAARQRQAHEVDRLDRQAETLDQLNLRRQRLGAALADIAWASGVKAPNAHVMALHWDHGLLAVEAGGDRPPLDTPDHPMQRSRAPLRPGVWLWGLASLDPWGGSVSPPGQGGGAP